MAIKVTQIVEQQVKAWSYRSVSERDAEKKTAILPVITISREFGAQGAALAEILNQRIGFRVWDKELLQAIADELGSDQKLLETLDERSQQVVEDTVAGFMDHIYTNVSYLKTLIRVVKTIEVHGKGIIVGRGANYICQHPKSLHVRIVAPFKSRVADFAGRENLSMHESRRIIKQKDEERAEFIRRNFLQDVSNASDYDLIINSDTYSLEQAADLILDAYEMKTGVPIKSK
jgi:cytidylate kinase